jgi:Domain of unknown function (DUF4440)
VSDATAEVLAAARARAEALAAGDVDRLRALLDQAFHWTSHRGATFDRDAYLAANTSGETVWLGQDLEDPVVTASPSGDAAVVTCVVHDVVDRGEGPEHFRMPMTQVWVRRVEGWVLLAGHAGPRLP